MCPAVPRIISGLRSPARLLPELHRAQGTAVGEVLGEELAQETLVRAPGRLVEPRHAATGEELAQRGARLRRDHTARRRETPAAGAQRPARRMAEHHGGMLVERDVTLGANVERGAEAKLGDDVPRARERRGQRLLV